MSVNKRLNNRLVHRQKGVALIVAIMGIATIAIVASLVVTDGFISTQRVYQQINNERAYAYFGATEVFAKKVLKHDKEYDQTHEKFDSCEDIWARGITLPIEGEDYYGGQLSDLGGRFNLYNLLDPVAAQSPQQAGQNPSQPQAQQSKFPSNINQRRFMLLLQTFNDELVEPITYDQAMRITAAAVDWMDSNNDPIDTWGAEADFYRSIDDNIVPANQSMSDIYELLQILQVLENPTQSGQLFRLLRQHVTIWPKQRTPINVNLASDHVLRSLGVRTTDPLNRPPLTESQLREVKFELTTFEEEPEMKAAMKRAFQQIRTIEGQPPIPDNELFESLSIQSDIFELRSEVKLGDLLMNRYTILQRVYQQRKAGVYVLARNRDGVANTGCL